MSSTWPVFKREFTEAVRTKMFVIGTLFGPLFIALIFLLPALMMRGGAKERKIVIADASADVGAAVAQTLQSAPAAAEDAKAKRASYKIEVVPSQGRTEAQVHEQLQPRLESDEIDGILWIPSDVMEGGRVTYLGGNATNFGQMAELRAVVQQVVQQKRLVASKIDPAQLASVVRRVDFEARTPTGTGESLFLLAYVMGYAMFLIVMLFGISVMRGAQEEKRDRIVEVVMSSIRARSLLLGKVLGIGSAALLQVTVWVAFAAVVLTRGDQIAARFGVELPEMPVVAASSGILLLVYFAGGFFLYSCLYATIGSIATTDQEAQQLSFPVQMLLMVGFFMMFAVTSNADGTASVAGSLIPFTSALVMPMRLAVSKVPIAQIVISLALLYATGLALIWAAAKIYRIGMLSTGKKPTMAEMMRWLRTA